MPSDKPAQLQTPQNEAPYICPCGTERCEYEALHAQEAAWEAEIEAAQLKKEFGVK